MIRISSTCKVSRCPSNRNFLLFLDLSPTHSSTRQSFPGVNIGNFGQMDERFLSRSATAREAIDQHLKDLGINTIIDLRNDPMSLTRKERSKRSE
jgi:hypothetical protein